MFGLIWIPIWSLIWSPIAKLMVLSMNEVIIWWVCSSVKSIVQDGFTIWTVSYLARASHPESNIFRMTQLFSGRHLREVQQYDVKMDVCIFNISSNVWMDWIQKLMTFMIFNDGLINVLWVNHSKLLFKTKKWKFWFVHQCKLPFRKDFIFDYYL